MTYKIAGKSITMTRGDTMIVQLEMIYTDGSSYVPDPGDRIRFAMDRDYDTDGTEPLVWKDIDPTDLVLKLDPEDTKKLEYGTYYYDLELTKADGTVDTFLAKGKLKLTEEVA